VNSTEGTSSGVFSSEAQQCIACPFGKYIVRPNKDVCTKCPKGSRYCLLQVHQLVDRIPFVRSDL
jgi:hypothetical protein